MRRNAKLLLLVAVMLAVGAGPGWLQAQMPASPAAPASRMPASLEGTVKKVDATTSTVRVSSGLLGLFPRTLEVTADTQVQIEGRQATLTEVQEGAKVKASYEVRNGKNIATRLEVMAPPPPKAPPGHKTQ
jgi:Cu/Ag efflux protein CusF